MHLLWSPLKTALQGTLTPTQYRQARRRLLSLAAWTGFSNSQYRMDRRIARLFGGKRNGLFIEAGAADGVDQSNTLYLERKLGWTGLLVEPSLEQSKFCKKVRRAIVEHAILCPFGQSGKTHTLIENGLTSIVKESQKDSLTDFARHVDDLIPADRPRTVKVKAVALGDLLDKHKLGPIDILSLDVEGAEVFVLKGVDFDKHRIRYLLVETNDFPKLKKFLAPHYTFAERWSGSDYLFKAKQKF